MLSSAKATSDNVLDYGCKKYEIDRFYGQTLRCYLADITDILNGNCSLDGSDLDGEFCAGCGLEIIELLESAARMLKQAEEKTSGN